MKTANKLEIPAATLHTWIHVLKTQGNLGAINAAGAKDMSALVEENRRLHKELAIAKEEREILKKAAAYFAQNRVARRMRYLGLKAKANKKFKVTTDSAHNLPVVSNLLNRDFNATAPNQKWCGDISYVWTDEGWMYLAVVIDLYSRAVVGWSIQSTMLRQLVCDALTMALWRRGFPREVLLHSDRGSQYCSHDYQKMLRHYGLISSMSRKGNCWDNAVAESFFHSLKTELIYAEKYATREIAKQSIFQYIEVHYNRFRRHSTIGSIAPMVFENQYKIVV